MSSMRGTGPFGRRPSSVFNFKVDAPAHALYFEDRPSRLRGLYRGETVVDSRHAGLLHETGLLPVLSFPQEDAGEDLLKPSEMVTRCACKGVATYHSARVNGEVVPDVAWCYPEPLTKATRVAGYFSFSDQQAQIDLGSEG